MKKFWLATAFTAVCGSAAAGVSQESIAISEVFYQGDANSDWVELVNTSNLPIDITDYRFCARFTYQTIDAKMIINPPARQPEGGNPLELGPGERIVLSAGMDLDNSASDVGLYGPSGGFSSPSAMADFVQYGTTDDVGRVDVAVAKGIWMELSPGVYDTAPSAGPKETLAWCGSNSPGGLMSSSLDFQNGASTQHLPNDVTCEIFFSDTFGEENPF